GRCTGLPAPSSSQSGIWPTVGGKSHQLARIFTAFPLEKWRIAEQFAVSTKMARLLNGSGQVRALVFESGVLNEYLFPNTGYLRCQHHRDARSLGGSGEDDPNGHPRDGGDIGRSARFGRPLHCRRQRNAAPAEPP